MVALGSSHLDFTCDDITPSLYAQEYVSSSLKGCSITSLDQQEPLNLVRYPVGKMINPPPVSTQISNHPLVYYSSHPLGLFCCDFRTDMAIRLGERQGNYSFLRRIEDDFYHFIVVRDGVLEVIDIRNPDVFELRWRFEGSLHDLRCIQCTSTDDSLYHILSSLNVNHPSRYC